MHVIGAAQLSFVPMADPFGKIKCSASSSKMMTPHEHFELADFENFDQYKEAVGYPLDDGFMVVDRCIYDSLRASIPRPYWSAWRDAQTATAEEVLEWWRAPPLEHIPHDSWQYMTTYIVWVSVLILGLGSEYVVGTVITAYLSMENLAIFWKAAAFTFPLFVTIALVSHAFWGLLFLVLGLWKCGSPETLVFLLMGLVSLNELIANFTDPEFTSHEFENAHGNDHNLWDAKARPRPISP